MDVDTTGCRLVFGREPLPFHDVIDTDDDDETVEDSAIVDVIGEAARVTRLLEDTRVAHHQPENTQHTSDVVSNLRCRLAMFTTGACSSRQ